MHLYRVTHNVSYCLLLTFDVSVTSCVHLSGWDSRRTINLVTQLVKMSKKAVSDKMGHPVEF